MGLYKDGANLIVVSTYTGVDKISYQEFLSSMRPSNRHVMLELAGLIKSSSESTNENIRIRERVLEGTSIHQK